MFSIMISLYNEKLVIQKEAKLLTQYTPLRFANSKGRGTISKCINFPPLCQNHPGTGKFRRPMTSFECPRKTLPLFTPAKVFTMLSMLIADALRRGNDYSGFLWMSLIERK